MTTWTARITAGVLALGLLATACTEDDGEAEATDTTAAAETTAAAADTTAARADTTAAAADTTAPSTSPSGSPIPEESGPADESLEPVVIGALNMNEGVPSFPGFQVGWDTAAEYINAKLGGIAGHPVVVKHCGTAIDPDSNQRCAQELANDSSVQVVVGGINITSEPIYPILEQAKLPISIQTPLNQSDLMTTAGFSHYPGNVGISGGLPFFAVTQLGAKSVAVIAGDSEGGRGAVALIEQVPIIQQQGITVTPVYVKDTDPDITGPLLAAGGDQADAILVIAPAPTCIQTANAMAQLGLDTPVLAVSSCSDNAVKTAVGDKVKGWYIGENGPSPSLAEGVDPQVDHLRAVFAEFATVDEMTTTGAAVSFGQVLMLWSIGNELGADNLNREAWSGGLEAFTGPVFMGPPSAQCPGPVFPAVCTSQSRMSQIGDGGVHTDANNGETLDPFAP